MNPSISQKVWEKIRADFDRSEQTEIAETLQLYTDDERERVQLYILQLAEGNVDEVYRLVETANKDYRDIIFWAENPEDAKLDTPEKREQVRKILERLGVETPENSTKK